MHLEKRGEKTSKSFLKKKNQQPLRDYQIFVFETFKIAPRELPFFFRCIEMISLRSFVLKYLFSLNYVEGLDEKETVSHPLRVFYLVNLNLGEPKVNYYEHVLSYIVTLKQELLKMAESSLMGCLSAKSNSQKTTPSQKLYFKKDLVKGVVVKNCKLPYNNRPSDSAVLMLSNIELLLQEPSRYVRERLGHIIDLDFRTILFLKKIRKSFKDII